MVFRVLVVALAIIGCGHHGNDVDLDAPLAPDAQTCSGLECFQYDCSIKAEPPTTVSGTVYAPNGTLPLYGVNVYVPVQDPGPFSGHVDCDRCSDGLAGGFYASTQTDEMGHFSLQNVPATSNVPLVIQVGKWRRQLVLPNVAACQDTPLGVTDTTLPKSRTDMTPNTKSVDLPYIAITTGDADALECLPLKLGVDPSEITNSTDGGHVQLFQNYGGGGTKGTGSFIANWPGGNATTFTDAQALWGTTDALNPYDIVIFSCEGDQEAASKPQAALQAVHDYAGIGGRVFMSHWQNIWISGEKGNLVNHGLPDWQAVATFDLGAANPNPDTLTATIDVASNPIGASFVKWMLYVGASLMATPNEFEVDGARDTCTAADTSLAEQWVYLDPATSPNITSSQMFQFTTPQAMPPDQRCGKVVFSDMHVSNDSKSAPNKPYPSGCAKDANGNYVLSAQEKALAFMFFNIASCVTSIE